MLVVLLAIPYSNVVQEFADGLRRQICLGKLRTSSVLDELGRTREICVFVEVVTFHDVALLLLWESGRLWRYQCICASYWPDLRQNISSIPNR